MELAVALAPLSRIAAGLRDLRDGTRPLIYGFCVHRFRRCRGLQASITQMGLDLLLLHTLDARRGNHELNRV